MVEISTESRIIVLKRCYLIWDVSEEFLKLLYELKRNFFYWANEDRLFCLLLNFLARQQLFILAALFGWLFDNRVEAL